MINKLQHSKNLDGGQNQLVKNQKLSSQTKDQIKEIIVDAVKKQKPKTTHQLIRLVQEKTALSEEEITKFLEELENEDKIYFTKKEIQRPLTLKAYIFSEQAAWFWFFISLTIATTTTIFAIPDNAYPIVYIRSVLSIVFILFLPGYTFMKALSPSRVPIDNYSDNMNTIERFALGLGLSFALVPIVGLLLYYTPWEIGLTSITLNLLTLTTIFAVVAIIREYKKNKPYLT